MKFILIVLINIILSTKMSFLAYSFAPKFQNHDTIFTKKYITTQSNSKSNSFYEVLELKSDSTFHYFIRVGLVYKDFYGTWKIRNRMLKLKDSDSSALVKINESYNVLIKHQIKHFEIENSKNEEIGYDLFITLHGGKTIHINRGKRILDLKLGLINVFSVSCVMPLAKFYPKRKSNFFKIIVNSEKVFFKNSWFISGDKIYKVINDKPSDYFLQLSK